MKRKPMDMVYSAEHAVRDANVRRYKEMCSVALTALSYVDMDTLNEKERAQYATTINELRRLKMEFEYS